MPGTKTVNYVRKYNYKTGLDQLQPLSSVFIYQLLPMTQWFVLLNDETIQLHKSNQQSLEVMNRIQVSKAVPLQAWSGPERSRN